jgi:hypothetical protein
MTRIVLALLGLAACESHKIGPMDREAAKKLFDEIALPTAPPGMSDLTIDDRGILWSIAERDRTVLEIDPSKQPVAVTAHPVQGIAEGVDTEAITWLGNGTFAIGTEGGNGPSAAVVSAELRGSAIVATATRDLSNGQFGVLLTSNHGIEALCGRAGELLAVAETVGKDVDKRWAPLVRIRGDEVKLTKLWLTTKTGKISAITCTLADDGTAQVTAIERHFGVARVLSFKLDRSQTEVTPTVDLDLHPILHNAFNLEGIARLPDGRIVAINDNQSSKVSGPTQLFVFHPR